MNKRVALYSNSKLYILLVNETPICVTCSKECGSHWCRMCKKPCHAVICGETHAEEGFGKAIICNGCSSEKTGKTSKAVKEPSASKDEGNFETPK